MGASWAKILAMNSSGVDLTFSCNVTFDNPNDVSRDFQLGKDSQNANTVTFAQNYTLTLADHLDFTFINSGETISAGSKHQVIFNGIVASSSGTNTDIKFEDKHTVTIGSAADFSGFNGDIIIEGDNSSGDVTVNGALQTRELSMDGVSDLIISTTGSVTATGSTVSSQAVETTGSGVVVVKTSNTTSGSFIAKNITSSASNPINMKFERALDETNANSAREWTLVSVPVVGENTDDIQGALAQGSGENVGKRAIGTFNNDTGAYVYYDDGASVDLAVGTGLAVTPDTEVTQVDFQGTFKAGDTDVSVGKGTDATYGQWNLVGNPFPSYYFLTTTAGANNFITENTNSLADLSQGLYAWDGEQWTPQSESAGTKNYIAPGEAFFVKVPSDFNTGNMSFSQNYTTVNQGANFNAGLARGASENKREATLKIKVHDNQNNTVSWTKLLFSDKATKGVDKGLDFAMFPEKNKSLVYTKLVEDDKGDELVVQALPFENINDVIVPLGISSVSSTLQLTMDQNTMKTSYVYLEDRLKNTFAEFDEPITVEFGDNENPDGRFYLHFTNNLIPELPTDDNLRIFKVSENEIKLMGDYNTNYKAQIFDFTGRLIKEVDFKHQTNVDELGKGIQILKIKSDINQKTTTKKFILR